MKTMKVKIVALIILALLLSPGISTAIKPIKPPTKKTEQATPKAKTKSNSGGKHNAASTSRLSYNVSSYELVSGSHRYKLVWVEGGSFMMGADDSEALVREKPVHRESISSFYMCQTEVPQWLWKAVMGSNPSGWKRDNLPVEKVSWDDCQIFLRTLNSITGQHFRLPTEAEWEYVARGGNRSKGYKYSGGDDVGSVAWYDGNSGLHTHEVGLKLGNELGLYDMSGNVWEWTSDNWRENYDAPRTPSRFVHRGGALDYTAMASRVTWRDHYESTYRHTNIGLRIAL